MSTHDCPGCGKPGIPRSQLACKPCWFRLPKSLRDDVNHGYRHDRGLHLEAITEAMDWYADHQQGGDHR